MTERFLWGAMKVLDEVLDEALEIPKDEEEPRIQIQMAIRDSENALYMLEEEAASLAERMRMDSQREREELVRSNARQLIHVRHSILELTEMQGMLKEFRTQYMLMEANKDIGVALENIVDRMAENNAIHSLPAVQTLSTSLGTQKRRADIKMRIMRRNTERAFRSPQEDIALEEQVDRIRTEICSKVVQQLPAVPLTLPSQRTAIRESSRHSTDVEDADDDELSLQKRLDALKRGTK